MRWLFLILIGLTITTHAQEVNNLRIDFSVKTNDTITLNNAQIDALNTHTNHSVEIESQVKDRVSILFDFDSVYMVHVSKPRHEHKAFLVDTRNLPIEEQEWGYEFGGFRVNLNLIDSPTSDTVAFIFYDDRVNNFNYARSKIDYLKVAKWFDRDSNQKPKESAKSIGRR